MQNEIVVMTSVRLPRALHEVLRRLAFERRVSLHSLLLEGATLVAEKHASIPRQD
jgi:hypothetical protein